MSQTDASFSVSVRQRNFVQIAAAAEEGQGWCIGVRHSIPPRKLGWVVKFNVHMRLQLQAWRESSS